MGGIVVSTNISKQKRDALLDKIQQIKKFISAGPQDENTANLLTYIGELTKEINGKKYGLVFEEHREKIDELLEENAPVLVEQEDLFIDNGGEMNFLIEGDNLAALKLLEKTHKGKIDVIYIDPPYNTGNKDFIYDDDYVDEEDSFRHSKWISFMKNRLFLAKDLLKEDGILFVSIDDNEQSSLKTFCDSIFQFVSVLPTVMNLKGNQDEYGFAGTHEYTLVYVKNKSKAVFGEFPLDEEEIESDWIEDEIGFYKKGATLKRTGNDAPREKRPYGYYPILINNSDMSVCSITEEEYKKIYNNEKKEFNDTYVNELKQKYENENFSFILPQADGVKTSWRWQFKKTVREKNEIIVTKGMDGFSLYKKQRPELLDIPSKKTKSLLYKPQYSSGNGTSQLKDILLEKKFNNPKPIELIQDFLLISTKKNSTILDFFAGSGTTGHAVMKLNAEDGGNRKLILCTNNENNICQDMTYQRLKTVITGKRKDGSEYDENYKASLKYFKIDYLPIKDKMYYEYADELLEHVKELVELENAIDFNTNKSVAIVLDDDELAEFAENIAGYPECKTLYMGHDVLTSYQQEQTIKAHGITINTVPDYYYRDLAN